MAITYFLERQSLVPQVMKDLKLDISEVGKYGAMAWVPKISQKGRWEKNKRWTYFLHGKGCEICNIETKEVIDWDCPNIQSFDPYSFIRHLEWRLNYQDDNKLNLTKDWVQNHPKGIKYIVLMVDEMIYEGIITSDYTLSTL